MAEQVEKSSGNVFEDLGFPDAGEHQMKAWIVTHILRAMNGQKLTQIEAARRMGLKQPDLSALLNGRFRGYSVERLARCLSALGDEVRLTVKSKDGIEENFVLDAV
jgi:predicted XRE-type DNA-binding protein